MQQTVEKLSSCSFHRGRPVVESGQRGRKLSVPLDMSKSMRRHEMEKAETYQVRGDTLGEEVLELVLAHVDGSRRYCTQAYREL